MNRRNNRVGFTIVELLVVIVVIAVLAGLVSVGFNVAKERAQAAAAQTALKGASEKLDLFRLDNPDYPTTGNEASAGVVAKDGTTFQYTSDGSSYCLTATNGTASFKKTNTTRSSAGGCPGHGQGGSPAITNLATNPSAETDISGVSGYYSPPISRDTSTAAAGSASFLTTTNSTTNPQGYIFTITSAAEENQVYTCSLALAGTAGATVIVGGRPATAANGYITEGNGSKTVTLSSSWTRSFITFTSPPTTGILRIQVRTSSPVSGVVIRADAIMCTDTSTVYQYADGNTANWIWNGTAHLSSSTGPSTGL